MYEQGSDHPRGVEAWGASPADFERALGHAKWGASSGPLGCPAAWGCCSMIRSWRFVITSESKARITRRPLSAMSWVWGWRGTNRAGGKVASITTWPVGTRPMTSGVWFSLSPPAVPITLTNTRRVDSPGERLLGRG